METTSLGVYIYVGKMEKNMETTGLGFSVFRGLGFGGLVLRGPGVSRDMMVPSKGALGDVLSE